MSQELRAVVTYVTGIKGENGRPPMVRLELTPPLNRLNREQVLGAIRRVQGVDTVAPTANGRHVLIALTTGPAYHYVSAGMVDTADAICREAGIDVDGQITPASEH
jgi:hypothetical protein